MANSVVDLSTNVYKWTKAVDPQAYTVDTNGDAVQLTEGQGNAITVVAIVGDVSGTTPTLDVQLEESADGSTGWTDVVLTSPPDQVTAADTVVAFVAQPSQPFVRVVLDLGGTTPSFEVGAAVVEHRYTAPANRGGFSLTADAANG